MKTFSHWRNVGRAMREARRREGVTVHQHRGAWADIRSIRWRIDGGPTVDVWWVTGTTTVDVAVKWPERDDLTLPFVGMDAVDNAAQVLRVLAALDLIPAHLAEGPDERYGRCATCGRLARWWDDPTAARWVHVQPWAVTGPNAHRAEVAE